LKPTKGINILKSIRQKVWSDPFFFVAFGFGSGLIPRAPGTWGSLVGLVIYILAVQLGGLGPVFFGAILAISLIAGIFVCDRVARELGVHDHGGIVWDEITGIWLVLVALPVGWYWPLIAFALFRLFDILKPWPIRWIDTKVQGGLGIMLDDVAAAIPAWLIIQMANWII
jgi:phosphatidylglycerophosphatase A